VTETAGQMFALAGKLEPGSLRSGIVRVAATLLEKSFGAAEGRSEQITSIAS
jgi:hypothetical protein